MERTFQVTWERIVSDFLIKFCNSMELMLSLFHCSLPEGIEVSPEDTENMSIFIDVSSVV